MQKSPKLFITAIFFIALVLNIYFASAAASLAVTSFSCSPSESTINSVFSCTAQVKNNGDASGTLNTATLYPDSSNWLESSNYAQSSGASISPGTTTEVIFTGLRAIKSGNSGFSKIMLDSVEDTYVSDQNKKVNIIDVSVTASNSASSAVIGGSVTVTTEVTAGGNIDVSLSFTKVSGGCDIGTQTNPKTISGMTDGSKQSRTFTVTQGSSGNCVYTISAAATGSGGVASKIGTTSSTITCTDCVADDGDGSTGSGGGGGGGAGSNITATYNTGELSEYSVDLSAGQSLAFNISGVVYTLLLNQISEPKAIFTLGLKSLTMSVGEEQKVDINKDGFYEVSVKLKTINIITRKATFILTRLEAGQIAGAEETPEQNKTGVEEKINQLGEGIKTGVAATGKWLWAKRIYIIIGIIIIIVGLVISTLWTKNKLRFFKIRRGVKMIVNDEKKNVTQP